MKQTAQNKTNHQAIKTLKKGLKRSGLTKAEYTRIQAVLLRKKGYSRKQIGEITGKSLSSVEDWLTLFHKKGLQGLLTKRRSPSGSKLSDKQKRQVKKILNQKKPLEEGFSSDFWDLEKLKALVLKKYRVEYKSATSYRQLMKYCGFSYQKVEFQDKRKPDSRRIKEFKKHFQGKLKRGAFSMWW